MNPLGVHACLAPFLSLCLSDTVYCRDNHDHEVKMTDVSIPQDAQR